MTSSLQDEMEAMDSVQIDANLGSNHDVTNVNSAGAIPMLAVGKLSSNNLPTKDEATPTHVDKRSSQKYS